MACDNCKKDAVALYGKGKVTKSGIHLPGGEHLCYECYCDKYGLEEEP